MSFRLSYFFIYLPLTSGFQSKYIFNNKEPDKISNYVNGPSKINFEDKIKPRKLFITWRVITKFI